MSTTLSGLIYGDLPLPLPIILLFATFLLLAFSRKRNKRLPLPPGPPALPIIGHLHLLSKRIYCDLAHISKKYGPVVLLRFGSYPTIVVSSPEMAKVFLQVHDLDFPSRPNSLGAKERVNNGRGLVLASYGEYWKEARKLLNLELMSPQKVDKSHEIRSTAITNMIKTIKEEGQGGKEINMSEMLHTLTFNIIMKMIFGQSVQKEKALQMRNIITEACILFGTIVPGDLIPLLWWTDIFQGYRKRMKKLGMKLDEFMEDILEEHIVEDDTSGSFINVLRNHGYGVDNDDLKALIIDIIAAGSETTSNTLEWALSELILNPSIQERAQEEIEENLGNNGVLDESCIRNCKYIRAIVKETLRLHPPAPILIPHVSEQDCNVGGYYIPKESRLVVNVWGMGQDPQIWERPLEFAPKRFMESDIDIKGQDFRFIPFGSGRRICVGMVSALRILEVTLAHLIHAFDWNLPETGKLDMEVNGSHFFGQGYSFIYNCLSQTSWMSHCMFSTIILWM